MRNCTRFREDGSACTHQTDSADGWCRQPDCPGFLRRDPSRAPDAVGHAPYGSSNHIAATGHLPAGNVSTDDVADIQVTTGACDSFRYHHGGSQSHAELQLRNMLEDFLLESARGHSSQGYLRLSRQGYRIVLSPSRDAITGYSTVHRERTWEQVKAGVKSRYKKQRKRKASGDPPPLGPRVMDTDFDAVFDPAMVYLSARVRTSFARLAGLGAASESELDSAIRAAVSQLPSGRILRRQDGAFEIELAQRIWLVSADSRSLIGVKHGAIETSAETVIGA